MGLFNKLKEKLLGKTEENKDSEITKKTMIFKQHMIVA
ncbi:hypothetical protein HMPREF9213_0356 [Lactobacillus iners LactinV 09V1-c]|nr:hypothetical protein HMPREF9213_0356 [Lactobacillus iners LactinV 09V1-c]